MCFFKEYSNVLGKTPVSIITLTVMLSGNGKYRAAEINT